MSYSPATGLVYIPVNEIGFGYMPPLVAEDAQRRALGFNVAANMGEGALPRDTGYDGILHERGMVSFKPVMDEAGAEAARAYVICEANWAKANDGKIMN